ncbi:hypothetical protein QE411_002836 [Microbacterium arborescens]|nr:hypothetical protein [Microbacterium arborescens]
MGRGDAQSASARREGPGAAGSAPVSYPALRWAVVEVRREGRFRVVLAESQVDARLIARALKSVAPVAFSYEVVEGAMPAAVRELRRAANVDEQLRERDA